MTRLLTAGVLGVVGAMVAGCGGTGRIVGGEASLPANPNSAQFLDEVSTQKTVGQNEAMRGLLLLVDGEDEAATFADRVEDLRGRGIVARRWDCNAAAALSKGRLAFMIWRACKIPGGVTLHLTGPSQRYCLRELQYRSIMTPGSWYTPVSGMEFVSVLSRASAYMETGQVPPTMKVRWSR